MRPIDIFYALIVAILWGENFIAVKITLQHFPPLFATGLRLLIVSFILFPFVERINLSFRQIFVMAFNHNVGHLGLLLTAVANGLPVSAAIIANQFQVPLTTILSIVWLNDHPKIRQVSGMIIAFIGLLTTIGSPHVSGHLTGFGMVIFGALFVAIVNIQIKQAGAFKIIPFLAYSSMIASPILFTLSYFLEPLSLSLFTSISIKTILALLYTVLSTIGGFGLWFYLLQKYSVNLVTPFALLVPVFGMFSASLYLHEPITWHVVMGSIVTTCGVAIITIKKSTKQ